MASEYPKTMTHPRHRNAKLAQGRDKGAAEKFPPVDIFSPDQEKQYRALGYRPYGEKDMDVPAFTDYPKMLFHPDHVAGVAEQMDAKLGEGGEVVQFRIPGAAEKFPPVTVHDASEQAEWEAKGWREAGRADPDSYARIKAYPEAKGYKYNEFPKLVDGKVVDPTATSGFQEYPKWVGGTLCNNAAQETVAREAQGMPAVEGAKPVVSVVASPIAEAEDFIPPKLRDRAASAGVTIQSGWSAEDVMDALITKSTADAVSAELQRRKGGRPTKHAQAAE